MLQAVKRNKLTGDSIWQTIRQEAAQEAVRKAHQEVAQATPRLKPYAQRNQELAQAAQKKLRFTPSQARQMRAHLNRQQILRLRNRTTSP